MGDSERALKAPAVVAELVQEGTSGSRLDIIHDQLKLIGAVLGLHALLEVVATSHDDKARVSAARQLVKLDEDPEAIAERLKAAPFADLTVEELEAIIRTGEIDPESAMETVGMIEGE